MANYRFVTITFRDGRRDQVIVKESDHYPELMALERLYGLKCRIGRQVPRGLAKVYDTVEAQTVAPRKGAVPARPLSADFGRGSGAPV